VKGAPSRFHASGDNDEVAVLDMLSAWTGDGRM